MPSWNFLVSCNLKIETSSFFKRLNKKINIYSKIKNFCVFVVSAILNTNVLKKMGKEFYWQEHDTSGLCSNLLTPFSQVKHGAMPKQLSQPANESHKKCRRSKYKSTGDHDGHSQPHAGRRNLLFFLHWTLSLEIPDRETEPVVQIILYMHFAIVVLNSLVRKTNIT